MTGLAVLPVVWLTGALALDVLCPAPLRLRPQLERLVITSYSIHYTKLYDPKYTQMGGIEKIISAERILEVIEGRDTTVAVHESLDGHFRFFSYNFV